MASYYGVCFLLASGLIGHFSSSTGMWVASQCNADRPSGTAKQHTPGPRDPLPYLLSPHSHPVALFPILLLCLLHHSFIYSVQSRKRISISHRIQSLLIHLHTRSEDQTHEAIMQYSKFAVIAALAAPLASAQNLSGLPTCAVRFYTSRAPPQTHILMKTSIGNCSHLFSRQHWMLSHRLRLYLQQAQFPRIPHASGASRLQPQRLCR